jgi:hypothetical protein
MRTSFSEADMTTDFGPDLSTAEVAVLRRVAGIMIPANHAFGVPGADDPMIFADIVRSLGRDTADVRTALIALGAGFRELDETEAEAAAGVVLGRDDRVSAALGRAVLQCYYRDDRVLEALGLEARAPFPKGHVLEQGDWSLLDVVRERSPLWRDDRRA